MIQICNAIVAADPAHLHFAIFSHSNSLYKYSLSFEWVNFIFIQSHGNAQGTNYFSVFFQYLQYREWNPCSWRHNLSEIWLPRYFDQKINLLRYIFSIKFYVWHWKILKIGFFSSVLSVNSVVIRLLVNFTKCSTKKIRSRQKQKSFRCCL